jgi:hypothetical protein
VYGATVLDGPEGSYETDSVCQPEELLTDSYPMQEGEVNVACALVCATRHPREVIKHTLNWNAAVGLLQRFCRRYV